MEHTKAQHLSLNISCPSLFALLELARIAVRRKVTQIQIKLFKLVSVSCFSFQLRRP
jgi:hypothetical protein